MHQTGIAATRSTPFHLSSATGTVAKDDKGHFLACSPCQRSGFLLSTNDYAKAIFSCCRVKPPSHFYNKNKLLSLQSPSSIFFSPPQPTSATSLTPSSEYQLLLCSVPSEGESIDRKRSRKHFHGRLQVESV
jgi:hypothetical protein